VQVETEEIVNNLRFAGQYYDDETGLYYNLNRYYDPATGRYLRTDPFGEGLNLYSYVFNNPLSYIDPLGLCVYNKVSDWVHGGLAVLGMLPIVGIVPDLIDTLLYVAEGEWVEAGAAGLAMIPIFGQGTRAVQYGAKAIKRASKYIPDAINLARKAKGLGKKLYRKILDKLAPKSGDDLVSVFHGSADDATTIMNKGLDSKRTPTWVSTDKDAAVNAITKRYDIPKDPGIIESKIPKDKFDKVMKPSERPYPSGFGGEQLNSKEIVLRNQEQINLFNENIVK
jgi:RHS repeat-associated protein